MSYTMLDVLNGDRNNWLVKVRICRMWEYHNILRRITLEKNENKPITNSRDTPEVCATQLHYLLFCLCIS